MKAKLNVPIRRLLILLPFFLTGCSLAPPYLRPAVETPAAYKETGPWKTAASSVQHPEKWWQAFADPVLDDLEEHLNIDNQNIKLAEAQYRAARAGLDSARAGLFPTLGVNASGARGATNSSTATTATTTQTPVTNLYTLSAQASWEIDLWGQVRSGVDAAGAKLAASEGALGAARLSAQALLAQSYFLMRSAEAQEALLHKNVAAYQRFLALTQNRQKVGVASSLDVAQAETQLNTTRTQLADAQLQRAQTEHAIATLIGKPATAVSIAREPVLAPVPQTPTLIPSLTLEGRYDIYSAERLVAAANAQIGVARAAYFPAINLSADGGFRSAQLASLITTPARFWSLGPALALTVFDGGARSAAVSQAEAIYDQAVATYRQTVLTAFQEVEDNLIAMRLLTDETRSQQAALAAARKAREVAENQYRAGTVASLNVITAQTSELAVENTTITIWNRNMAAAVQLYKNTNGRLLDANSAER